MSALGRAESRGIARLGQLEGLARELAESWVNGNRTDVLDVLCAGVGKRPRQSQRQAARVLLAVLVAEVLAELGDEGGLGMALSRRVAS